MTFSTPAQAIITPLSGGFFEVSYEFDLKRGTLHGSNITDIVIFETDGTQVNLAYPFSAASMGPSTISHTIAFDPILSLILGIDSAPLGSGLKDHLVVFMDNSFTADGFATKSKFSEFFPAIDEERFASFLGVPLIEFRKPLGVLAIQNQASRAFTHRSRSTSFSPSTKRTSASSAASSNSGSR